MNISPQKHPPTIYCRVTFMFSKTRAYRSDDEKKNGKQEEEVLILWALLSYEWYWWSNILRDITFTLQQSAITGRPRVPNRGSLFNASLSLTMIGIWQLMLMFNVALANSEVDLTRVSAHGRTNGADAWPIRCKNGCRLSSTCTECTKGRVHPYRRSCDTF